MFKNFKNIFVFLFLLILVISIFTKVNAETPFTFSSTLKYGTTSLEVKELQKFLNLNGFLISPAGPGSLGNETTFFGPLTKKAVILFQRAQGLLGDGIVGPKTRGHISSPTPSTPNPSNNPNTPTNPSGCTPNTLFNPTTGLPCGTPPVIGGGTISRTYPLEAISSITGTPMVGEVLTAGSITPEHATVTYQWQI